MLNKENYVPCSSRLLRYAKSRPNGKLIHKSILNGPYVRKMIPEPGDANRDITTILLGLPEDIYAIVDSCETAQEIWLRVQQMMKGFDIGIQEKKAKRMQMVGGNGRNQFKQYAGQNAGNPAGYNDFIGNQNGLIGVQGNGNQNQIGNGNLVVSRVKGNAAGQNGNQIRCYNCRGKEEAGIQLQAEEYDLVAAAADLDEIEEALSREELYFSNNSKTANVSKSFLIPNEDLSDDTTPSVARKFLNEVKSTIVTLQRVVKQRMTIETHNWASSAHQELHKIVREEIFPIVNQVDARLQNFKIQFLKEAVKFIGDFKSLAKEADDSLAKHNALELEIERLLKAVVSQDIMITMQNESIVDTSDLQTEVERMKECYENCIIKKETEYAKLCNDWYKKCDECKYDKISYDKAYKDMQQKIERLQAQLGDLKGKSKDTSCVSDTRNQLSQKLKTENVELEL
nr:hypothetical protein [Tanacetum cinerariifolium]